MRPMNEFEKLVKREVGLGRGCVEAIAQLFGVDQSAVSRWRKRGVVPPLRMLQYKRWVERGRPANVKIGGIQ